ncbi:unnamed protein product [Callosobruchus maculatus]|uniref:Uncharacterized protein n=1 Tax=Callosobruchus maculatus TaxID=64391 RepID=A0A653DU19_CALMS|nr:unnamed protein product [Callosobruchus maculatus]
MEGVILRYAPSSWVRTTTTGQYEVSSSEFNEIAAELRNAGISKTIKKINRYQNVYDFGQVLIREQHLTVMNPGTQYYRVRRYVVVEKCYLNDALEYNLDYRRINRSSEITFSKSISVRSSSEVVLVVQIITDNKMASYVTPKNCADFFIEYIVEF